MKKYVNRVCIQVSILLNVLFGGKLNQTISATQHQRKRDGKANIASLIDSFFFWEVEHCMEAWLKWKMIHMAINKSTNIDRWKDGH